MKVTLSTKDMDKTIYEIFNLSNTGQLTWSEFRMMLLNLPDIGWTRSNDYSKYDEQYKFVREATISDIQKA